MFFSPQVKKKLSSWFSGVVLLGSLLIPNPMALAQIGVSPLVIQIESQRGKAQGIITVKNTTNQPTRVRIYTESFIYEREQGFKTLKESEQDLSPYLRFSPREMTIPPQSERRVRLLAQLAPSLPEGEYRTAVFAESLTEAKEGENLVGILARIAVVVYVTKGDLTPNLIVENAIYDQEKKEVKLLVNNLGKVSVLPKLVWKLSKNGQLLTEGENPETTVMAESDRFFKISPMIEDEKGEKKPLLLEPGNYQLSGELIWQIGNNNPKITPFEIDFSVSN